MKRLPRHVKRSARPLLEKCFNSLQLSVELFNRPSDDGRVDSVLILFDHATEMLLKASILQCGAKIHDKRTPNSIGFKACINRACDDPLCGFLSRDEARVFDAINALRDAAQHFHLAISEEQLYFHIQSGITLIRDVLERVFGLGLGDFLPRRVLPLSTVALTTIELLYDEKIEEIRRLLAPGRRKRQDALAALRPLVILERSIRGLEDELTESDLERVAEELKTGADWSTSFPGVSLVEFTADGSGPSLSLRMSKKEGIPFVLVPPETGGVAPIALKRVNELDFYSLSTTEMAKHLGITVPKFCALAERLDLQASLDYYKLIEVGKVKAKRYSPQALKRARDEMKTLDQSGWAAIWDAYCNRHRPKKKAA